MLRIRLFLLTAVVAVVGLAPSTAAARGNVLPTPTYDAILAINEATIPFDDDDPMTAAQLDALRSACKGVPKGGALLTSLRRDCDVTLAAYTAIGGPCETEQQCLKTIGRMAEHIDRLIRQMVSSNRVINRTVPAGACRVALRASPAEIRSARQMAAATHALHRAMRRRDPKAIDAASKQIDRVDERKNRSAVQIRNAVRDRC